MLHLLCYLHDQKEHIGTNVENTNNLFPYLENFFGVRIDKVVVVETRETIINHNSNGLQLELFQ